METCESLWEPLRASLYDRTPSDSAEEVREGVRRKARELCYTGAATDRQLGYMNGLLTDCFGQGDGGTLARHQFLEWVFGLPSSKALSKAEASAVIDWLRDPDADGPHPAAVAEAWLVVRAWAAEHGQQDLGI